MAWRGHGSLAISSDQGVERSYLMTTVVSFSVRIPILIMDSVQNNAQAAPGMWKDPKIARTKRGRGVGKVGFVMMGTYRRLASCELAGR